MGGVGGGSLTYPELHHTQMPMIETNRRTMSGRKILEFSHRNSTPEGKRDTAEPEHRTPVNNLRSSGCLDLIIGSKISVSPSYKFTTFRTYHVTELNLSVEGGGGGRL